MSRIE